MTIAIFCGDRNWYDKETIKHVMLKFLEPDSTIIHGVQRGADLLSESVAEDLGIGVIREEADWDAYGPGAGPIRNSAMLDMLIKSSIKFNQRAACFAFHNQDGLGTGTYDMVVKCIKAKIRTHVWIPAYDISRASHLCVCSECKRKYINHPQVISELDQDGNIYLTWICERGTSGNVVKL